MLGIFDRDSEKLTKETNENTDRKIIRMLAKNLLREYQNCLLRVQQNNLAKHFSEKPTSLYIFSAFERKFSKF